MASDLKIEIFAFKLFHEMWFDNQVIGIYSDFVETYGDESFVDDSNVEACDNLFIEAMYCRHDISNLVYKNRNSSKEIKKLKSLSDLYEYIIRMCDGDDIFCRLSVFERMFATIEFAAFTCYLFYKETDCFTDILRYGHVIWAMYFDKFTAEFYEKGGWSELKREANRCKLLSEFDINFYNYTPYYLSHVKEATVNYFRFKNVYYQEWKFNHKVHVSKLWIQFQIEHFRSCIHIPSSYDASANLFEVELLMKDLKLILDHTNGNPDDIKISKEQHQGSTFSAKLSYSKIHCASDEMKAYSDNKTQIQNLSVEKESRIIHKTPCEVSHIFTDYEEESKKRSKSSVKEEPTFDIFETNENPRLDKNTSIEMEPLRQTSSTDTTKDSQVEQNILPAVDTKKLCKRIIKNLPTASDLDLSLGCISEPYVNKNEDITNECFYESNVDKQADITNTDQVLSCNEMEKNEYHKDSSSNDRAMSLVLDLVNESINNVDEMENPKDTLKMSCSKKDNIKTSKTKNNPSVSQNVASNDYGLACSVNENLNSIDEIEKIRKAREVLRNEQKDPEVRNFVRNIMVLGDMEGTKFLLSMLQKSKEQSKNSKKSSNKKKKRK